VVANTLSLSSYTGRFILTVALFTLTLAGVVRRPRGWHEAWWTCGGAVLALGLGLVRPAQALGTIEAGREALLFLLALLLLSLLLDKSGFFEWAAIVCARASKGYGHRLFRNFLFLGALVTITLSLDTTAVLLTPLVLVCAHRVGLPGRPFVVLCALVSNVASLLLPVSNLTNLLLVHLTGATFAQFVAVQLLPQLAVLAVLAAGLWVRYGREIPARFDVSALPEAASVVPDGPFFRGGWAVLLTVLGGYFLASRLGFPVWAVAIAGVAALGGLAAAQGVLRLEWFRELPIGIFPFVAGLFVLVRAVENLGLEAPAVAWLQKPHGTLALLAGTTGAAALLSNVLNNLPAVLFGRSVLVDAAAPPAAVYGALLGANVGPCFGVYGSLATVLVLAEARRRSVDVKGMELARLGVWLTPLLLLFGVAALWLVLGPLS
jgi:arsenical pump membrane protein